MYRRSNRPCALLAITVAVFPLCATSARADSELTRYLNDHYKGKTFIIRGFYAGGHLTYDSRGEAVNPSVPDDWTVAGVVRVEGLRLSGHHLRIEARRLHFGWPDGGFREVHDVDRNGKPDKDEKKKRSLLIEADLGLATDAAADRVLSQIFLASQDNFADLVPDYWKPCMIAATTGKGTKQFSTCRFSDEFSAIPGVIPASGQGTETDRPIDGQAPPSHGPVYRAGYGITPPTPISHPAAEFSDEARRARYGGTSVVGLVVDQTGGVRNIRILKPLGMKLDQRAVETALKYTFNPATKDGQPVAVEIALEVDFHLY